jgi:predicted membrane chloride channel (bestrophin family)
MLLVAIWVTVVTLACEYKFKGRKFMETFLPPPTPTCPFLLLLTERLPDKFDPILLTVLGFLVGITLSFRNQTAYTRFDDGRKYWAQLTLVSNNLARVIWVHAKEREGEQGKEDLLGKMCVSLSLTLDN